MAARCGAWQVGDDADGGAVEFRLFFPTGADPQVTDIRVGGTFQPVLGGTDWDFRSGPALVRDASDPRGVFWAGQTPGRLPAGFYEYLYQVTFTDGTVRVVSDPCTRYGALGDPYPTSDGPAVAKAAVVVGGSRPAENVVRPLAHGRLPLSDLNIYELMVDDFTAEFRGKRAPLDAVGDRLDDLRGAGFNAILFMPWTAWKNRAFDWGYEPFQYYGVEARYANDLDAPAEKLSWLKRLVSACHDRDIHVIMDGVFNHVSRDFPYRALYRDPADCPFTAEAFGGSFPGLQDLDFTNACTGELIRDVCLYWITTVGIDGIRLDNTVNYYVAGNVHGLPQLLSDIQEWCAEHGENNFSLTLEHIDESAATVTEATAATSFWDDSLFGLCFDGLWNGTLGQGLVNALNNRRWLRTPGKLPTLYLSNHDHSQVGWQAGARTNTGAADGWYRTQPYVIALFTSTATPLVANGQEFGEEHWLPEDDHGTGRRVTPRPLRWKLRDDPVGQALHRLYAAMARMRRDHPALRSGLMYPDHQDAWQQQFNPVGVGVDVQRRLAVYHRWAPLADGTVENAVVVLNFADTDQPVSVPFPVDGEWTDLLAGYAGVWTISVQDRRFDFVVGSHWGHVFCKVT